MSVLSDHERDGYEGPINLVWESECPSADTEETVRDDIARSLWGLSEPSKLAFHHVFLTDDHEGPSVFVYGENGSGAFHCRYLEHTEWVVGRT